MITTTIAFPLTAKPVGRVPLPKNHPIHGTRHSTRRGTRTTTLADSVILVYLEIAFQLGEAGLFARFAWMPFFFSPSQSPDADRDLFQVM